MITSPRSSTRAGRPITVIFTLVASPIPRCRFATTAG